MSENSILIQFITFRCSCGIVYGWDHNLDKVETCECGKIITINVNEFDDFSRISITFKPKVIEWFGKEAIFASIPPSKVIGQRFKYFVEEIHLTSLEQFSREFRMSIYKLNKLIKGEKLYLNDLYCTDILKYTRLNLNWLIMGDGEPTLTFEESIKATLAPFSFTCITFRHKCGNPFALPYRRTRNTPTSLYRFFSLEDCIHRPIKCNCNEELEFQEASSYFSKELSIYTEEYFNKQERCNEFWKDYTPKMRIPK